MKINFNGHIKDVLRVINTPQTAVEKPRERFEKLLGEFEPKSMQPIDLSNHSPPVISTLKIEDSSVMARYNIPEPKLQTPTALDQGMPLKGVKSSAHSAPIPTVVGAKRVSNSVRGSLDPNEIHKMIDLTGTKSGVDPALSLAVAKMESSFNPRAVSSDGHASKGLFQLLDSTGKHLHSKLEESSPYDPFNPSQNARLGVEYLRYLHDIFSRETQLPNALSTIPAANSSSLEKLAVAAFNAGEGRVASAQARAKQQGLDPKEYENVSPYLPDITQQYVQRVLSFKERFSVNNSKDEVPHS